MCIAIECSYKLDQKNEFKFLCELCTFLQIRSHIATIIYTQNYKKSVGGQIKIVLLVTELHKTIENVCKYL